METTSDTLPQALESLGSALEVSRAFMPSILGCR